jgi:hypothetical protein
VYNHVVEGMMALTGYYAWHKICVERGILPGMQELVRRIGDDERGHMAWGDNEYIRPLTVTLRVRWPVSCPSEPGGERSLLCRGCQRLPVLVGERVLQLQRRVVDIDIADRPPPGATDRPEPSRCRATSFIGTGTPMTPARKRFRPPLGPLLGQSSTVVVVAASRARTGDRLRPSVGTGLN